MSTLWLKTIYPNKEVALVYTEDITDAYPLHSYTDVCTLWSAYGYTEKPYYCLRYVMLFFFLTNLIKHTQNALWLQHVYLILCVHPISVNSQLSELTEIAYIPNTEMYSS